MKETKIENALFSPHVSKVDCYRFIHTATTYTLASGAFTVLPPSAVACCRIKNGIVLIHHLGPVEQRVNTASHRINPYQAEKIQTKSKEWITLFTLRVVFV